MIFAMQGQFRAKINDAWFKIKTAKCGIFDLSDNTWMMTKELKIEDTGYYACDLTHQYLDRYNIYLASDVHVSKYDFCKDEWYTLWKKEHKQPEPWLRSDNNHYKQVVAWIDGKDPSILHRIASEEYAWVLACKPEYAYFDMRDPIKKWKESKEFNAELASVFSQGFIRSHEISYFR